MPRFKEPDVIVKYISTRGGGKPVSFNDALIEGLSRDGGLYVPEAWPVLSPSEIAGFRGKSYAEVAMRVVAPFVGDDIPARDLERMIAEAYATFDHPDVTPLRKLSSGEYILELFHGPTLAFKDVAMQLIARLMDYVLAARGERATIVGATSGDTGGAATEAFRGRERIDLVFLFPRGRVSPVQERMMTAITEKNVNVAAVEGTFDDCQAIVKALFNDHAFRERVKLSGVNSINFARIVAQIVYYFTAAVALGAPEKRVIFAVPTGNFGDIFAGYVASRMGLPIAKLAIATNVNDILAGDGYSGFVQFRAAAVRCLEPRRVGGCRSDARSRGEGQLRVAGGCARKNPRFVRGRAGRRAGDQRDDCRCAQGLVLSARPAHGGRRIGCAQAQAGGERHAARGARHCAPGEVSGKR